MPEYSAPRRFWRVIYPPLIYLGVSFAVSMIAAVVYGVVFSAQMMSESGGVVPDVWELATQMTEYLLGNAMLLQLLSSAASLAVFIPMWLKTRKQLPQFSGTKMTAPKIVLIVFAGLAGSLIISAVVTAFDLTQYSPAYELVESVLTGGSVWLQILAVIIAAPIVEELIFRGVVFNRLLHKQPVWFAVVIQGVLFGFCHLNLLQGVYAFIFGCALALLYVRSRNILLTIIAHIAFNSAGYILNGVCEALGVTEISVWGVLAASAVVFAVSVWLFVKQPTPAEILPPPENPPEVPTGNL